MSFDAETRPSLIRRVQSGDDAAAWDEFSSIYRPVIVRLAITRGLQPADAEDLAQQVLMSVSRNIRKWNKIRREQGSARGCRRSFAMRLSTPCQEVRKMRRPEEPMR